MPQCQELSAVSTPLSEVRQAGRADSFCWQNSLFRELAVSLADSVFTTGKEQKKTPARLQSGRGQNSCGMVETGDIPSTGRGSVTAFALGLGQTGNLGSLFRRLLGEESINVLGLDLFAPFFGHGLDNCALVRLVSTILGEFTTQKIDDIQ